MARKNNNMDIISIMIFLVFVLGYLLKFAFDGVIKFFGEINNRKLWKECNITIVASILANIIPYSLLSAGSVTETGFAISCSLTFIAFCVYWWYRFNT